MVSYSNGYIPDNQLVTFDTGVNSTDGRWYHKLSPGTYAKHQKLVALAKKNTGRTLQISDGWGAYRPYDIQVLARKLYGTGAAVPGTSSHGGIWYDGSRGWVVSLAIDYSNWGYVYGWDRDKFYRDVRAVGLEPGLIHPSRGNGYPDEPWHVVDLYPWAPAPSGGKTHTPLDFEEEDMYFVFVQGKQGKFNSGQFAFMRDNGDKWFAKRISTGGSAPAGMPVMDYDRITSWQKTVTFHDA